MAFVSRYALAFTLLLGILLRVWELFFGPPLAQNIWSDMRGYVEIADLINGGIWRETHFFQSIGFPLLIAALKRMSADWATLLAVLNTLGSILTLLLVWLMASTSFGRRTGVISLLIAGLHLPWITFTSYAMPESLFTLLLACLGYLGLKIFKAESPSLSSALLWGLCFALAAWLKNTHVFLGPLMLVALFARHGRTALKACIALCLPVALGLGAHWALSLSTVGRGQLTPSAGGLNFVEGKCPEKKNRDSLEYSWQSPLYYQLQRHQEKVWPRPFTDSGYFFKQGLHCITDNPFTLVQSLESIPFLFFGNTTWPLNQRRDADRIRLFELLFAFFLVAGLGQFIARSLFNWKDLGFGTWIVPMLALFLCVYVFKSELRFRVPFDVWFIPMAVEGWLLMLARARGPEATLDSGR